MKNLLIIAMLMACPASAQTSGAFYTGAILTAPGLNAALASKQDYNLSPSYVNMTASGASYANAFEVTLQNFPSSLGTFWTTQYHANWNVVQSAVPYNPTEWQVYSNAAMGIAQIINGTNQVVLVRGTPFDPSWVGKPYFIFEGSGYKVASVVDASHLTVQTTGGGAVSWGSTATGTYYYVTTSVSNICNVAGTSVTYVSGQPFISIYDSFSVNGTPYSATYATQTAMTLGSSAGTLTGATCQQFKNITGGNGSSELSNLRLQGLAGSDEENFVITETPAGAVLQTTYAGGGKYRPILIMNGEQPAGTGQVMAGFYPNATLGAPGFITLGGSAAANNEALAISPNANNVNFFQIQGGIAGSGPLLQALGTDANIAIVIQAKGTAPIYLGGPLQVASYTVASLPTCNAAIVNSMLSVTDASGPTYNGSLTGGGTVHIPVFCNGAAWTAH